MNQLNINDIESIATQAGFNKIGINTTSRVISFRTEDCRINVYYTTGTVVGTSLYHKIIGKSQLFRRNVSISELKQIFQNPRIHTGKGYYHASAPRKRPFEEEEDFFSTWEDEETTLRVNIKDLEAQLGLCYSQLHALSERKEREAEEERQRLAELERRRIAEENARRTAEAERLRLAAFEAEAEQARALAAEAERTRLAAMATIAAKKKMHGSRGEHYSYKLPCDSHFPSNLKNVVCVAIGGGGYVAVFESGRVSYDGVPSIVVEWLKKQQDSNIAYISIGYNSQWFGQKKNGKYTFYCTNEGFEEKLRQNSSPVKFCAFGDNDHYYVQFKNGRSAWCWPKDSRLSEILEEYSSCVENMWLGEDGSYFVVYDGGRTSHRGLSLDCGLEKFLLSSRYEVKQLLADEDGHWFVRFN